MRMRCVILPPHHSVITVSSFQRSGLLTIYAIGVIHIVDQVHLDPLVRASYPLHMLGSELVSSPQPGLRLPTQLCRMWIPTYSPINYVRRGLYSRAVRLRGQSCGGGGGGGRDRHNLDRIVGFPWHHFG